MAQGFITQQSDRSVPGALDESSGNAQIIGTVFPSPAGGVGAFTVTELGAFVQRGWFNSGTFQMAIYDLDGDGDLDNLIGSTGASSEKDPPASEDWVEWTGLNITIDGSTNYAIVVWADDAGLSLRDCATPGDYTSERKASAGTPWTWPDLAGDSTLREYSYALYAVYEAAGADVNVSATTDALVITENAVAVAADTTLQSGVDALTLTENTVTIAADTTVQAGLDALVITENAVTIAADTTLQAGVDTLTVTAHNASVTVAGEVSVSATTDALILTENAAVVDAEINVASTTDALIITENAATVSEDANVSASIDPLILSELAATVDAEINVAALVETLVLAEYAASVMTGGGASSIFKSKIFHGQESFIID